MKLINKKTGETYETTMPIVFNIKTSGGGEHTVSCESITELNEKWEDYQGPETFWYISPTGTPIKSTTSIYDPLEIHLMKRIGNYFESEEDSEKAVEKCIAWTRLKDNCGISFSRLNRDKKGRPVSINLEFNNEGRTTFDEAVQNVEDLTLLFGGGR